MRYLYCPNCKRLYSSDYLHAFRENYYCPNIQCSTHILGTELIELDEFMAYPILLLNQKGYMTSFCCSGHIGEDRNLSYIAFERGFCPITLPFGWTKDELDEDDNKEVIRLISLKEIENSPIFLTPEEKVSQQNLLFRALNTLLQWAIELPNREDVNNG